MSDLRCVYAVVRYPAESSAEMDAVAVQAMFRSQKDAIKAIKKGRAGLDPGIPIAGVDSPNKISRYESESDSSVYHIKVYVLY